MKLPRLTIRRLMLAVALVAVLVRGGAWAIKHHRNAVAYREEMLSHHRFHAGLNRFDFVPASGSPIFLEPPSQADLDASRRRAEYHEAMVSKYEHAARYPWLPVAPDPPEPR